MALRAVLVAAALVWPAVAVAQQRSRTTHQDFDRPGSPYAVAQCAALPPPEVLADGPSGSFLRLASTPAPNENSIAFDRTVEVGSELVVADFDMRIEPTPPGRADGLGFALLDTSVFGEAGPVCPSETAEEPGYARSLGIGFDIYRNDELGDVGNDVIRDNWTNTVTVHFDGRLVAQIDATEIADLASGQWTHVRVVVAPGAAGSTVDVVLTPFGGRPTTVVSGVRVDGLAPYRARAQLAARSGGQSAAFDLDNVRVVGLDRGESAVSFESPWAFFDEFAGQATLVVTRVGDLSRRATVRYETRRGTASGGSDFRSTSGTLTFAPGEATKPVRVRLRDDARLEADETFTVRLESDSARSRIAGPDAVVVTIYDDETARLEGRWDAPRWWPILPVHAALLPGGDVLFWDRLGANWLWDPSADLLERPGEPPFDVFCAGHAFLPDGRLLVAGGHHHGGHPEDDGVGVPDAAIYDPVADLWTRAPDMNGGRWYPTNTALGNGDVLVASGSVDDDFTPNLEAQVWEHETEQWRDLPGTIERAPYGVDLYPRMFLGPDGRVFKAGPDRDTWFLDPDGAGSWARGPLAIFPRPRTYGPAAMYAPGKILVAGGANPPTETAEVIDLNDAEPAWRAVAPMAFARRHANMTLLPDGTALVTGGTSGPGFNNQTEPVLEAELWDPATEQWRVLPAARIPRLYHSVALLLPDGRVVSAGGGQGGNASSMQSNAEVYYPAYLFRGPRPSVADAPSSVRLGESFVVTTPDAVAVRRVTLVRLPSVTHAFDENQRFLELEFTAVAGGLSVTAPSRANDAPVGHYMLFVIDDAGVPSVARIVSITGG